MGGVNNHSTKPFTKATKRAVSELWRAKVPLKAIRSHLWSWLKMQLRDVICTNMEDWRREIVKL